MNVEEIAKVSNVSLEKIKELAGNLQPLMS